MDASTTPTGGIEMALCDYKLCDAPECEETKTFYDARLQYEDYEGNDSIFPMGVGDWKVICYECSKKYEVVIKIKE